jgi:hypothetical protein
MNRYLTWKLALVLGTLFMGIGCDQPINPPANKVTPAPASWLGISSAVNQVIVCLHEGTGWLLNKSEVSVKKAGDVRSFNSSNDWVADYQISVRYGGETFETTAKDVPCDKDGIPTEAAVDRLRLAVEDIKAKMKRLQN